jgi:MFS transporter, FHS family, glucose/mannose:H+ symporter
LTEPGETSFTRLALAGSLGAFVLIGAIDSVYGPLLHPLSHRFGVSLAFAGTIISVNFTGALIGVLCALAAFRRAPTRPIATFAQAAVAAGCLTIAASRNWPLLAVGVFITGIGFGATDFSLNQLMTRTRARGRAVRLTIVNSAFGAGAVLGPVCANVLGSRTLVLGFAVASVFACAMSVSLTGISTAPPAADPQPDRPDPGDLGDRGNWGSRVDRGGRVDRGDRRQARARRHPGLAVAALGYLLYVGCEAGTAGWIPAHLESFRYSAPFATGVTSGFWGAMAVGRILAAPASRAVAAHRMVLAACSLLAITLALTAVPAIAPVCYVAAGLAAAPIFPIGLDWLAATFPRDGPATSWALIGSFAGGIAGPAAVAAVVWLIGVPAVPAVLSSLAAATTLAFAGLRSKVVHLETQTAP